LFVTAVLVGCGSSEGTGLHEVQGEVTFKGKPLEHGSIQFIPDPAAADSVRAVAPIQGGKYDIPKKGGLKPGQYKVIISSSAGAKVKENEAPGVSGALPKEILPPEYNVNTKQKVEVKAAGPNKFDFTIP
jgi:hypothetical protein